MNKPLNYFVEKLNNIQCFQLYINKPQEDDLPEPKIQIIKNNIHINWGKYLCISFLFLFLFHSFYYYQYKIRHIYLIQQRNESHITLDCEVDGNKSDYQVMADCLEINIPFHKEKGYVDDSFQKLIRPKGIYLLFYIIYLFFVFLNEKKKKKKSYYIYLLILY